MPIGIVSTHSRPKAAGSDRKCIYTARTVSTHSRPKAAGYWMLTSRTFDSCFNTQPPEGGWFFPFAPQFGD